MTYDDFVKLAYANGSAPSLGAPGANGIQDAYGSAYAAPNRYDYYRQKEQEFVNALYAANPDKMQQQTTYWGESQYPVTNNNYVPAEGELDPYQQFNNSLTPSQQAEYQKNTESNYGKKSSTMRGAAAVAMAAIGGAGALEAGLLGGVGAAAPTVAPAVTGSIGGELTAGLSAAQIAALGEGIAGSSAGAAGLGGAFSGIAPELFTGAGLVGGTGTSGLGGGGAGMGDWYLNAAGQPMTASEYGTMAAQAAGGATGPGSGYTAQELAKMGAKAGTGLSSLSKMIQPTNGGPTGTGNNGLGLLAGAGLGAAGMAAINGMNNTSGLPAIPNFTQLAEQTSASKNQAVNDQTVANRPNQQNAAGDTSSWSQDPATGQWTQKTNYSAANQAQLDSSNALAMQLRGQAANALSNPLTTDGLPARGTYDTSGMQGVNVNGVNQGLPAMGKLSSSLGDTSPYGSLGSIGGGSYGGGSIDYSKLGDFGKLDTSNQQNLESGFGGVKEVQDAMMRMLQPGMDSARQTEINRLKAQGIPENSPAWQRAMDSLNTSDINSRDKALMSSVGAYGDVFNRGLAENNQLFGQSLSGAQLLDSQRGQRLNEQVAAGNFAEGAANRSMTSSIAGAQLSSQNQNQLFNQALAGAQFGNASNNQVFNQNLSQQQLALALRGQQFGEQTAMAGLTEQQRAAMLNEQMAVQQNPLNNLKMLNSLNPSAPAFNSFTNAAGGVGTDYTTAGQNTYQGLLGNYNAETANNAAKMNGIGQLVGGLGNAAINNPNGGLGGTLSGIGGLISGIGDIGKAVGGWFTGD